MLSDAHTAGHMNSQETLVERDSASLDAVLTFSRDDMRRTTLSLRGFGPTYTVSSDQSYAHTSVYRYGERTPLVVTEQRGFLPDRITFNGKSRQNLGSWLKFSTLTTFPVTFKASDKKYVWKSTVDKRLVLYLSTNTDSPIAWFTPAQTSTMQTSATNRSTTSQPAHLTLRPEAIEIQDEVVISFLILEHKSRTSVTPPPSDIQGSYAYYYDNTAF